MNLQKMLQQAKAMQAKLEEAQAKAEQLEVEGSAGGGMVKITLTGKGMGKKIAIDDSLIEKAEKEMLEDLIIAALNDAKKKSEEAMQAEMSSVTAGMQLPPGMKLPF